MARPLADESLNALKIYRGYIVYLRRSLENVVFLTKLL